ncbi:hypothetical protein GWC77_28840, partial [Paraburkholderia sp. NMBU_R16]|nr:hypothetical protein [Paraburkholderia sp. NMBU_R16]
MSPVEIQLLNRPRKRVTPREHRDEYPSQWAAIESIAPKIGCTSQTLLGWVKREEVDSGER